MASKKELEQQVKELQEQLAASGNPTYAPVDFIRCPDNQVGVFTEQGTPICLITSSEWTTIVARMSVDGANGTNLGIAMRLHEGR